MDLSYIINTTILCSLKCYYITINSTSNQLTTAGKCIAIQIAKRSRYSNRTVKYSIKQPVVLCQLTQSSYTINHNAIMYIRGMAPSQLQSLKFPQHKTEVYIYTCVSYIQVAIVVVEYLGLEMIEFFQLIIISVYKCIFIFIQDLR